MSGHGNADRISRRSLVRALPAITVTAVALALVVAAFAPAASQPKRGTLHAIAGTGKRGYSGDGGPARKAKLNYPWSIAVDGAGNVYFTAPFNHRVRKIDTHGKITTIAGTGKKGFSGDGGPARNARLHTPYGVATDQFGNVYIADLLNWRVRKVDTHGTITTFAGTGHSPDVFHLHRGDGGPAMLAPIEAPDQIATDRTGNVYIGGDCTIRKIDTHGIISTIIGGGLSACGFPGGPSPVTRLGVTAQMAVDSTGNLYVADPQNQRIRKITAGGTLSTFAGTGKGGFSGDHGPARKAKLYNPLGVAVDGKDAVFIAVGTDPHHSSRVRKIDRNGVITTVAGNGKLGPLARDGQRARTIGYWAPHALTVDHKGNLLIAGYSDQRVWSLPRIAAPVP
jgi:hypothetical protein